MRFLTVLLLLSLCIKLNAQQDLLIDEASIRNAEQNIKHLADTIFKGLDYGARITANNKLKAEMKNLLQSPNTFNYAFDSLKNLSKIKSDDDRVRIYTWIVLTDSGNRYIYNGFIQYRDPKKKFFRLFELREAETDSLTLAKKSLHADSWYGAVYYKIIETKKKKDKYYTLLGWKGNNTHTTKKVIEILTFNNDEPVFGKPILQYEKRTKVRIIFEFNAEASMLLHWDEKEKKIIFDHLAPANAAFKNQIETYGPTFQYDALVWRKGKWLFMRDIDARNTKDSHREGFTDKKKREFYVPAK